MRFSTMKDPYQVLGLARNATMNQIKEAYLSLSKKYHPDINSSNEAKDRFLDIHQAYKQLKSQHFYDSVEEEFKKNYYSTQSEEECFKKIFGFYFHENPQEYFKPENAQKRADYQELLQKYKFQGNSKEQPQYDIKINRTFDPNSVYRNSDHTMIKVIIMAAIVFSVTGAYVLFYKRKDSLNRNTTTESQILRMKTLALIRQQKLMEEKQQQKL